MNQTSSNKYSASSQLLLLLLQLIIIAIIMIIKLQGTFEGNKGILESFTFQDPADVVCMSTSRPRIPG